MRRRTLVILFFYLLSISTNSISQISSGGKPASFKQKGLKKCAVFNTPNFDYHKLQMEDEQNINSKSFKYGKVHQVYLTPENSGTWYTSFEGGKIWQLRLSSKGAHSISLLFKDFRLTTDAKIYIYSPDRSKLIGAFTAYNNKESGQFSCSAIAGEEIIVELNLPVGKEYGCFSIAGIVHDYKNAFGLNSDFGSSQSCNVNINCPEGKDWQIDKRAVVKFISVYDGITRLCSGVLVNNTAYNLKPYLLTANHCIPSESAAASVLFMFNYESPDCGATADPAFQSISSSKLIATTNMLDFSLVELSVQPPQDYNAYFAGWNRRPSPAANTTCIHHPEGDIKKISFDHDAPVFGSRTAKNYIRDSYWKINEWDVGTTEHGSSGSPLYDENHLIIGNLSGGWAECSSNYNDFYTRFDMSWDYFQEPSQQLKVWLDPLHTGAEILEGYDPNSISVGSDVSLLRINGPNEAFCSESELTPEFVIQNKGTDDLVSAIVSYQINKEDLVSKMWIGNLETGETDIVRFDPVKLSEGIWVCKAFVSMPNGENDSNNFNDTLTLNTIGQKSIENLVIEGSKYACRQKLSSVFSSIAGDKYLWKVSGGEIVGPENQQQVEINWNEWGDRTIDLNVSNYCNSVDAQTLQIEVVEKSISLEIQLGDKGESVCWRIEDCEGNIILEDCELEANTTYTTTICIPNECYRFGITSEQKGVQGYSLKDAFNNEELLSGGAFVGNSKYDLNLNGLGNGAFFNLYPNPVSSELVIEAAHMELYSTAIFAIYNLNGERIMPCTPLDERKVFDVSSLHKGIYIVEIISSGVKYAKKFVKL